MSENITVKELKELLEDLPDDMEVILQKDAEGNGFSPLFGGDINAIYIPDTPYSGVVYDIEWTADDACMSEKQWNKIKELPRVLVLFPIN